MNKKLQTIIAAAAILISLGIIIYIAVSDTEQPSENIDIEDTQDIMRRNQQLFRDQALNTKTEAVLTSPSDAEENHTAINLRMDDDMAEVAPPSKTFEQILFEIEKEKRDEKKFFISVSDEQLDKEVSIGNHGTGELRSFQPKETVAPGAASAKKIYAPVTYKLFTDHPNYLLFQQSNHGIYPKVNFETHSALLLISESILPHRTFEMCDIDTSGGQLKVYYRVNPQANSEDTGGNYYNVYVIPKTSHDAQITLIKNEN